MSREIIDHTADIRVRVRARYFPAALLEVGNFMLEMLYGDHIVHEEKISSEVDFTEKGNCVIRFLNDLLYVSESQSMAMNVKTVVIEKNRLKWEAFGEPMANRKNSGTALVKAATYDRLVVMTDPPLIEVTFDI